MDLWLFEPQQNPNSEIRRKTRIDFPKLSLANCNQINHPRESSIESRESEGGYDNCSSELLVSAIRNTNTMPDFYIGTFFVRLQFSDGLVLF